MRNFGGNALERVLFISIPLKNPSPRAPPATGGMSAEISAPGPRVAVDGRIEPQFLTRLRRNQKVGSFKKG